MNKYVLTKNVDILEINPNIIPFPEKIVDFQNGSLYPLCYKYFPDENNNKKYVYIYLKKNSEKYDYYYSENIVETKNINCNKNSLTKVSVSNSGIVYIEPPNFNVATLNDICIIFMKILEKTKNIIVKNEYCAMYFNNQKDDIYVIKNAKKICFKNKQTKVITQYEYIFYYNIGDIKAYISPFILENKQIYQVFILKNPIIYNTIDEATKHGIQ